MGFPCPFRIPCGRRKILTVILGRSDAAHSSNQEEDLHCLIMADTEEKVNKAKKLIHNVIETVSVVVSPPPSLKTSHNLTSLPQAASIPEGQNELKRNQLRELAALNGTLRDDENQACQNCGQIGHRKYDCPEKQNFTANIICRVCGNAGHMARDCPDRQRGAGWRNNDGPRGPAAGRIASGTGDVLDREYDVGCFCCCLLRESRVLTRCSNSCKNWVVLLRLLLRSKPDPDPPTMGTATAMPGPRGNAAHRALPPHGACATTTVITRAEEAPLEALLLGRVTVPAVTMTETRIANVEERGIGHATATEATVATVPAATKATAEVPRPEPEPHRRGSRVRPIRTPPTLAILATAPLACLVLLPELVSLRLRLWALHQAYTRFRPRPRPRAARPQRPVLSPL